MNNDGNSSDLHPSEQATDPDDIHLELYSIVLSVTLLVLAILFGGGGCVTVLIAMFIHRLLRKLRYILIGILILLCSVFDFIWCPIEISRLLLYQQNAVNGNTVVSLDVLRNLKYISSTLYVLLLSTSAAIIILICVQNFLKIMRKYDSLPKIKLGIIFLLIWLIVSVALTIGYILVTLDEEQEYVVHNLNKKAFHFKLAIQVVWIILVLVCVSVTVSMHFHSWKSHLVTEVSDLHSNENFTVPSLIIKSVEEMEEEENEESSVALPSPDIQKDAGNDSPVSRTSKSAMKKRSGSPSSQKVLFADEPSPTHNTPSPKFGERLKTQNHLEVNMAAILGRRRHTIAQISDPQFDMMQKAKTYNYVRKFSVDISALQAQLENPKIHNSFPFHSQQDIKDTDGSNKKLNTFGSQPKCNKRSRDEIRKSQEIAEEPEQELENQNETGNGKPRPLADGTETQSVHSQCASVRSIHSTRDSMCPTPPLISLTQSDGEEKQLEVVSCENNDSYPSSQITNKLDKPCKLSCLLVFTFLLGIIPMFITEVLWEIHLSDKAYVNIDTCMIAFSMVQTMIFPQVIFCVDANINKAVHLSFVKARITILSLIHRQQHVPTNEDISDTEV